MGRGLWCGECPKCVFVFTLLSAFLNKKELVDIFGKNLYEDKNLLPLFKDILGFGNVHPHTNLKNNSGIIMAKSEVALPVIDSNSKFTYKIGVGVKPFDCVGTFEEAQTALYLTNKNFKNDFIVKQFIKKVHYSENIFKTQLGTNISEQFKFLGMENAYILGYGREGKITRSYLRKKYPKLKIGIGDESLRKDYLERQYEYDIAIKTPGIKKELVTIPYATATNIFFSQISGKNMIIGVTGSKGKSTTASLIYEILKTSGKDVILLGNIGKPMLEALMHPIPKNRIFVLELSSYQLDDIRFSPDVAVVTNLFPEHMDYHGGLKNYYEAKHNIIRFQNENSYFVYDPNNKEMKKWLRDYKGRTVPFSKKVLQSNLLGTHNQKNIGAAISVAKILQIPDSVIKKAVRQFKGLSHRLELVGQFKGITFYDDAISTTPESTILAIEALKNIDTIFLGGEDRGYDFKKLEKVIKKYNIRNIVLFPESGKRILRYKKDLNVLDTSSMEKAVIFAYGNTGKGKICLLSCASPSYSLWKNFEEKGDQFKKFVIKLSR